MKEKIEILITLPLEEALVRQIANVSEKLSVSVHPALKGKDVPPELWERVEVLYTMYTLPEAGQAPRLRWVQFYLAGVDKMLSSDLMAQPKLQVTTMSGANASQVGEHALSMMLALGHHLPEMGDLQRRGEWLENKGANYIPAELRGSTVGIIGYGSVGRQVARLVSAFGARVLASKNDLMHPEDSGYTPEGMGDPQGDLFTRLYPPQAIKSMLKECDFVVVTVPLTEETKGMIGAPQMAAMKPSAYLVDVSRGGVVDLEALAPVLAENKLAGAALDVFPEEPLPEDHPLWKMPNVIITPHVAGFSPHYDRRANELFVENLKLYLVNEPLLNRVHLDKGY